MKNKSYYLNLKNMEEIRFYACEPLSRPELDTQKFLYSGEWNEIKIEVVVDVYALSVDGLMFYRVLN
jgi:hypothetical protein